MATSQGDGLVQAVKVDLRRLHESWMELWFPRQRDADHGVLGKWKPSTQSGLFAYRLWSALGVPTVGLLYPFVLFGYFVRFQVRRVDSTAARLGVLGVLLLSLLVWGALTAISYVRLPAQGFVAVAVAAAVATVAAVLAVVFTQVGGRATSVLLGYPMAVTAIFLPPVVAAFYSPVLGDIIFPNSNALAAWFLDRAPAVGDYLRTQYDLTGTAYILMWFAIAVPVGWLLGLMVTLASVVRPSS